MKEREGVWGEGEGKRLLLKISLGLALNSGHNWKDDFFL